VAKRLASGFHADILLGLFDLEDLCTCFHAGILLGLFYPDDGGDMFLRNVG
jgi:hypothetical protein